jgi:hypothetical protein
VFNFIAKASRLKAMYQIRGLHRNEFIQFAEDFSVRVERKMNSFGERKSVEGDEK